MNFFRDHALALYNGLAFFQVTYFFDLLQCILCILSPDDFSTTFCNGSLKIFQGLVKALNSTPLKVLCFFTGKAYIAELLLSLRNYRIVFTYIKIDLTTMFPVGRFFCALYV